MLADAVMEEVALRPVGGAEIEMAAVRSLEEAGRRRDPRRRSARRHRPRRPWPRTARRLAGEIGAALRDRRREAEVEAEQGRRLARPSRAASRAPRSATRRGRADQPRRLIARLGDGDRDALVPLPLGARPVDRGEAREMRASLLLPRLRRRLRRGPVARALDHRAHPLRDRAVEADQHRGPAFIMRRLPEGVGIGLLEDLDRVEVDRDAERGLVLVAGVEEGAAVRRTFTAGLP